MADCPDLLSYFYHGEAVMRGRAAHKKRGDPKAAPAWLAAMWLGSIVKVRAIIGSDQNRDAARIG